MGHEHPNTKSVINRLARISGHVDGIKGMVEEGRDCSEVLIQLAAVKSALNNVGKLIIEDHIKHCVVHAVQENDLTKLDDLNKAIEHFLK